MQQYEEHIGSVNTITFLDNNRKFVSTGDDKKVFLWVQSSFEIVGLRNPRRR